MRQTDGSTWKLTAAAAICGICALLAWNSLEVRLPDQPLDQVTQSAPLQGAPKVYRAIGRAEIMLQAAGRVLN